VLRLIDQATPPTHPLPGLVKAIIAPHAGYLYSGPIAGSAFASLGQARVTRVVLIGPSHFMSFEGIAASPAHSYEMPFGAVPVDQEAISRSLRLEPVRAAEAPHRPEHSLEVELPFLQQCVPGAGIVPLLTGALSDDGVAEVLDELWGGDETRIVISSDLSHYLECEQARRVDEETARGIEALEPEAVDGTTACGWLAIRGLLKIARWRGLACRRLDLRNSGETAGPRDRVVGYGAWAFCQLS
jgi:AmmeMemoRadiSam system protein B